MTTTAVSDWRELARREGDGLVVSLSWTRAGDRVEVAVAERMLAEELHVERARARSMPSTTPFAYAAGARLCTGDAMRESHDLQPQN